MWKQYYNHVLLALIALLGVCGCQSTAVQRAKVTPLLLDEAFAGYQSVPVESAEEIFALDDDAKQFVAQKLAHITEPRKKMRALMSSIFDRSDFNLLYDNTANTVASDTFHNKAANCLSMSIMTYSLAKEADLDADFQQVDVPDYWTRRAGFSLLTGHINLRLTPEKESGQYYLAPNGLVIDFYPFIAKKRFPQHIINKKRVMAMFYNNKGADALLENDHPRAYAYFRAAIDVDSEFESTWVNLGLLYRQNNHHLAAEHVYKQTLKLNPENLTIWENLVVLYANTNREDEAQEIREFVAYKRNTNPYYHYIKGEELFEQKKWTEAIVHFKKAIRIDDTKHLFYFGLARSYYQMGDIRSSERYIRRAKKLAQYLDEKERYQSKLNMLAKN